jgi:hypothetical protein
MSLVKIQGNASGTGEFTIAAPNSNTNRTLTLPDNTGTIITTASTNNYPTGPAFSAYKGSDQTVTSGVITKVTYDTEVFDTNSNFASSTFTPTVAGYYQVNATICGAGSTTMTVLIGYIYKNGSSYRLGVLNAATGGNARYGISDLIYMNGTTDYLEIYARVDGTGTMTFTGAATANSFSAVLVRAA